MYPWLISPRILCLLSAAGIKCYMALKKYIHTYVNLHHVNAWELWMTVSHHMCVDAEN